ncbi:iron ABC transporter permease [Bacillus atrophaeus]|uniref:FecCD family ABC transporter permease n=1 Tax=Bacillus atrophaeus TaxID=1452 RepID=UPI00227FAF64|nr:iron chelate uptake ABC transporter family permease subunit [Bacillus atrophaeus]MCY8911891.1 iron ABC transporter permease [Bacillus atrophaeus]MCY9115409.1 iron ABC transporter permease [Bacillus atrophaeus]MEC0924906.1 iron chelate uptake ABC transporter family permease subunit [Bacillus atrophaeus]MEC0933521.1 iron chelate uptake ABC transporter family permease subunit [Bacillus atrophaeus]
MKKNTAKKTWGIIPLLTILLVLLILFNLGIGDTPIAFADIIKALVGVGDPGIQFTLFEFRLPRIALAVLAGAALAVSGVIAQSVMRNPLAAPDTLGLTGGAGLGAAIVTILLPGAHSFILAGAAFSGSVAAAVFVYLLAYREGISPVRLALVGCAVSAFCHSGIQLLISRISPNVNSALVWLSGSLWGREWDDVLSLLIWAVILIPLALFLAGPMDLIKSGDDIAKGLGVSLEKNRLLLLAITVFLTAAAVSAVGTIGFIGLMTPHIARKLGGFYSKQLIPISALIGAIILLTADAIGRGLIPPIEIPAGLIVAVVGGPFFLYQLWRASNQRKKR